MPGKPISPDRLSMSLGSVALVYPKAKLRGFRVDFAHISITRHLRQDGSRRDRKYHPVPSYDGLLAEGKVLDEVFSVEGNQDGALSQKGLGEGLESPSHREQRRPSNVETLYLVDPGPSQRSIQGVFLNPAGEGLPFFRSQLF